MRQILFGSIVVLVSLAASGWAAEPSGLLSPASASACPVSATSGVALPGVLPAPSFLDVDILCGDCSNASCLGLVVGEDCYNELGVAGHCAFNPTDRLCPQGSPRCYCLAP